MFLGFTIDTTCMKLFLPDVKVSKVKSACQTLLDKKNVPLAELAHVTGFVFNCFTDLLNTVSLVNFTRVSLLTRLSL